MHHAHRRCGALRFAYAPYVSALASAAHVELLHQRRNFARPHLRRERADVAVADAALAVDEVGLRRARDAELGAEAAGAIVTGARIRIAIAVEPGDGLLLLVHPGDPVDRRRRGGAGELVQVGALVGASMAP